MHVWSKMGDGKVLVNWNNMCYFHLKSTTVVHINVPSIVEVFSDDIHRLDRELISKRHY